MFRSVTGYALTLHGAPRRETGLAFGEKSVRGKAPQARRNMPIRLSHQVRIRGFQR
ncbi:MAG: hypothetical protein JSV77_11130 [Dehalococcoidales bacterium]|nr:MAG: hypothetical protein JSV77_11130 [Dehalococcoidales bacterium]